MFRHRHLHTFGDFSLDPVAKVLFRKGEPVHLPRKAVETLLVLVENAGRVLTKEEIITAVWGGRVVDEANLAQNIAVVRKALSTAKGDPACIETFPGRGYRLEGPVVLAQPLPAPEPAPVQEAAPAVEPRPAPEPQPRQTRPMLIWPAAVALGIFAVAAGTLIYIAKRDEPPPTDWRLTPLIRLTGKEFQPAVTADGRRVAFVWRDDDINRPGGIWSKYISDNPALMINRIKIPSTSPAWAPDAIRVAFLQGSGAETDIVVRGADGPGIPHTIARVSTPAYGPDYRMLDWSPDGKLFAVSHSPGSGRAVSIHLVDAKTGVMRQLTQSVDDVGHVDPRFSPDGKRVSYIRIVHRLVQEIWSVPVDGSAPPTRVVAGGKRITCHDWTPDGQAIVFASDRTGEFRLWRQPLTGGGDASREPGATGVYSEFPLQFAISRQGSVLAYTSLPQDRNIWKLDLPSLTWKRTLSSSGIDASPVYSPDGSRICFRSDRSGEEHLWLSAADGSNPVQITKGSVRPSVGRWAPDGRSIVFNDPRSGEIFVVHEGDDHKWSMSSLRKKGSHPVVSPDGRWIYAGGQTHVFRFPYNGGEQEELLASRGEALAISRDGTELYFMREPNSTTLWKLNVNTRAVEQVLDGILTACTSCWSLAPGGIYYLGSDRNAYDQQVLYFHDTATKKDRVVLPYPEPLWPIGSGPFSLSPDGKSLLCVRVEPSDSDIMLVIPFR